jgi:hypothetical protein
LVCTDSTLFILDFYLHEAAHLGSANGALVGLHPHNLGALNAQTHVSAGKHHRVLGRCIANHAFSLRFISNVSCIVINTIDIIQVKNCVIILK